jgi:hypothetical protein
MLGYDWIISRTKNATSSAPATRLQNLLHPIVKDEHCPQNDAKNDDQMNEVQ